MKTENELPKRKHPRLKEYDYSSNGYYFVTICTKDMKCIFGRVEKNVGWGLAPTEREYKDTKIALSPYGLVAEKQLFALEKRYDYVKIDKYVIMPNHIHAIIVLDGKAAGARSHLPVRSVLLLRRGVHRTPAPRPTLPDIMCAYKSLTTRECNKISNIKGRQIFQASFYEKVIRSEEGYLEVWQYIDENPRKWQNDEYFA